MRFEERYVRDSEKAETSNKDKKVISNDAYAIGEMLESLVNMIARKS